MIRELFTSKNHNFYEGKNNNYNYNRKEIFTKESIFSRSVDIDNSEILRYLFLSDFKHIYYSNTIIQGSECICLILDEYLISEDFTYIQGNYGKLKELLELIIDNYPLLPNTNARHRLLCTIRIDKHSDKETDEDIYIYSYSGKTIDTLDQDGEFNFGQSLNFIKYSNYEKKSYNFIIFPEGECGIIKAIYFADRKLICSRLNDFYNKLLLNNNLPSLGNFYNKLISNNNLPINYFESSDDLDRSDILNVLFFFLSKNYFLNNLYLNISIINSEIIFHVLFDSNLTNAELIGFPTIVSKTYTNKHSLFSSATKVNRFSKIQGEKIEKKIIFISIRQRLYNPNRLIYFSYFGYDSKLIDDKHDVSSASDSFSLAFDNGKYIRSYMWGINEVKDRDWFVFFYNDDSKCLFQLPISEIETIPKYNNITLEQKGCFYYAFRGISVKSHGRLVDLLEDFSFEYDFRHKEIFRHIAIKCYDDKS